MFIIIYTIRGDDVAPLALLVTIVQNQILINHLSSQFLGLLTYHFPLIFLSHISPKKRLAIEKHNLQQTNPPCLNGELCWWSPLIRQGCEFGGTSLQETSYRHFGVTIQSFATRVLNGAQKKTKAKKNSDYIVE